MKVLSGRLSSVYETGESRSIKDSRDGEEIKEQGSKGMPTVNCGNLEGGCTGVGRSRHMSRQGYEKNATGQRASVIMYQVLVWALAYISL